MATATMSLVASGGCIAWNVPSQRFHDASDRGGLLGPWTSEAAHASLDAAHCRNWDGGPLRDDCDDPATTSPPVPKEEVPWPRFHPLPTRPILPGHN